mgnify:CR=1 FL=1|tara:strand:- start:704 stop:3340 length:2637 start_codon:yes stop_codon:yes gene_type:complete
MAAITQRISNYLGGVSKQSDDKMLPGQVRECFNGFPDATYGLTKRPGFKHIANLGTGTTLDDAKWFYINRDNNEIYVGAIKGSDVYVWNADTGVACTVTYGTGAQSYLSGAKQNYKLLTVQDTTIVVNSAVTVGTQAAVTVGANLRGTVVLESAVPSTKYSVTIQGVKFEITSHQTDFTFDDILTDKSGHNIKDAITNGIAAEQGASNNDFTGTWTVTKFGKANLDIKREVGGVLTTFTLSAKGGVTNTALNAFQDEVASVGLLPAESFHNHKVKIVNTESNVDDYYVNFIADNGVSGSGFWKESLGPNISPGLDTATMPHELINTGLNTFTFQKISYEDRLVGDDLTNSHPSFVGNKISAAFFNNNRLGFLSKDNVIMSRSGEYYSFYFETAQTTLDSDPIDISCSSILPTTLHAVLPTAQGVILFSPRQQFILFADSGVLTPALATIRAISNYEMDSSVDPVDVGTNINFISKTPSYTRVFSMVTKGQQQNPQVLDLSRVVKEWISADVDLVVSSPQNSMIAMSSQQSKDVYIYRYYSDGETNLMEAWSSWTMPGTTQFTTIDTDDMFAVTKQANQVTLLKAALSQSPEQAIIINNNGQRVNPAMDLYKAASSVVYDSVNNLSKCYLPYNDVADLTPVIVIAGDTQTGAFVESGFTITPERASDGTGPYFIVPNKDLTSIATDVIVGFKYNFDIHLPTTYYRPDPKIADYTANLTIGRMKFSVGLSGVMSFKVRQKGRLPYEITLSGDGTTTAFPFNKLDLDYVQQSDVKVTVNGIATDAFTFTNETTITFTSAPANGAVIKFIIEEWFITNPVNEANTYLANDVPLDNETIFTVPIHQRTENFKIKMFNNTPFPVAVNAMMWEGNYTPRFYKRQF